jgi:TfoX/Sxy family transcriptional regulator of competence genes
LRITSRGENRTPGEGVACAPEGVGRLDLAVRELHLERLGHAPDRARITAVAYDEELAARIRVLLTGEADVAEKPMFGGLAFLVGGNMAVAASGQGGLLVRVDPEDAERLLARTSARPMEMHGRELTGWLRVDAEELRTKRELAGWVELGTSFARSLPVK